jgi:hypothetical protein
MLVVVVVVYIYISYNFTKNQTKPCWAKQSQVENISMYLFSEGYYHSHHRENLKSYYGKAKCIYNRSGKKLDVFTDCTIPTCY